MSAGQHTILWEEIPGHNHGAGYVPENGEYPVRLPQGWFCSLCGRLNRVGSRADADRLRMRSDPGFMTVSRSGRAAPPHCTGCGVAMFISEMAGTGLGFYGAIRFGVDPNGRWR